MNRERTNKNLWTFLRNAPSFLFFLPAFWGKTPVSSPTISPPVSSSAPPYAQTDTPLRIAHSASSQFLPSPFTFTRKSLFYSFLHSYGEAVKAKNEKQRTRALRVRVGAEVRGRCTFGKGHPVVGRALQVWDEPKTSYVREVRQWNLIIIHK